MRVNMDELPASDFLIFKWISKESQKEKKSSNVQNLTIIFI